MSKFNQSTTGKNTTVNREGYKAYKMEDKELLVTMVLTTMFGEPKFYGSTDNEIIELATEFAQNDPEFLCKLACYARHEGNLRTISHVLTAIIARYAKEYTRRTIRNVVVRADDITEIMSCYKTLYGKPFPNAMKREIANVIQKFDEYALAKYKGTKKDLSIKDVLRITHPVPKNKEIEELFNKVINDNLATPYTWETELSAKGNTKEVWDELIQSGKVGYMALLRNLNNIIKSGANIKPVLEIIGNPAQVKNSKQLPFRFYSAFKKLCFESVSTPEVAWALEDALTYSVDNLPKLEGRTLIAVDVSGSMMARVSRNSDVTCRDISVLLGCMSSRMCDSATVVYFNCDYSNRSFYRNSLENGIRVCTYGKYDSIFDNITNAPKADGGTDMTLPMIWALEKDTSRVPFDRVIYISDNECNCFHSLVGNTVQTYIDKYRKEKNPNLWVHAIDLQGYGTQQFNGKHCNIIAGWSDSVLPFIKLAEDGICTLVDKIEQYEI